jgi:hypothetical protein
MKIVVFFKQNALEIGIRITPNHQNTQHKCGASHII